ncbi:HPP family protein [Geodermatophilus sp. SYSU D00703]
MVTLDRPALDGGMRRTPREEATHPRLPTVAEVMTRHPGTVGEHASLFRAWGLLWEQHGEHLVVVDEAARPIGVLDERDIALEWPPGPLGAHHLPVHQLLRFRTDPRVSGSEHVATGALTMLDARADALPVVDEDGRLTGLVTAGHCVELIASIRCSHDATPPALTSAPPGTNER